MDDRQLPLRSEGEEFFERNGSGSADNREIVRADEQQRGGSLADRGGIILHSGLAGGPHLPQYNAAGGEDLCHGATVADFNQLAARDDYFTATG